MVKLTKWKRIEKAKVKLKAKKLPKGKNITDTSFKSKKIVIPGQLAQQEPGQIYTAKKLNVKELIAHLRHYNVSMRRDGLLGLTELINNHEENVIKLHLPKIIDSVLSLIIDEERQLRKNAMKLVELLLSKITTEQIAPHFEIMRTYMSCAMTHIDRAVQEDSLLLLDILVDKCPLMVANKAGEILPIFLNMVSTLKNQATHNRTLSSDINNRISNVQWRMKVFARLTKYFATIVRMKNKRIDDDSTNEGRTQKNSKNVSWTSPLYAGEHMVFKRQICKLPNVFSSSKLSVENDGSNTMNQESLMKQQVGSIVPILFEAWIEVAPDKGSSEVNRLSEEAAFMLQYVINTLQNIWDCLLLWEEEYGMNYLTEWFKSTYRKDIKQAFLLGFPYSLRENIFQSKGSWTLPKQEQSLLGNTHSLTPKCTQQNLSICYLLACLYNRKNKDLNKQLLNYLKNCIEDWESIEMLPTLEKFINALLMDGRINFPRKEIVQAIVRKCNDPSVSKKLHSVFFHLLCNFVLVPGYEDELSHQDFQQWISELPCTLLQPEVSLNAIQALLSVANQNNQNFLTSLKKRSKRIIKNLREIKITGSSTSVEGKKLILNMLFYIADSEMYNSLWKYLEDTEDWAEIQSHILNLRALSELMNM